jgi:hypothetical protein
MWTYLGKRVREGRVFTDNTGRQYPPQWWYRTTDEEKTALGLVHVADPAPYDNRFYWSADVPKALDDVNEVDTEGNPILDERGNQVITRGLKYNAIAQTKVVAGSLLAPTDWMVIKASEVSGYTVPSAITTYRAAVRTASNTIETAITNAADHAAFMALYDVPMDDQDPPQPTGNAPINDWPDEI